MKNNHPAIQEKTKVGFFRILKDLWPNFMLYISYAFTVSALIINLVILVNVIWPGEALESHASELGLLGGGASYAMAFSGILFGILADKFSRVKLMAISELIYGMGLLINGFVPQGQGLLTFGLFFVLNLIRGFSAGGFTPLINSFSYDSTEERERSQFFGILQALFQLFQILGMLFSAILFQNYLWRQFYWGTGAATILFGIIIIIRANEPKRGSKSKELKAILTDENIKYEYKLNWSTIKATILRPTNIIALLEGIFTSILIAVPDFLLIAYLQSDHGISALATSIIMIGFGLPGGVLGSLVFAKLSDKLGTRNLRNRLYIIVGSAMFIYLMFLTYFYIPLPYLSVTEGLNIGIVFSFPIVWLAGILIFFGRGVLGLWNINQPPILQAINLPEAQGTITSTNQFLETIGQGSGTILAGALLVVFEGNYQITASITMGLGIIGGLMWLLAAIWVQKDANRISEILKQRGMELNQKNKK